MIVRCKRCNRRLKDPISKKRRYGPICYEKVMVVEAQYEIRIHHLEQELTLLKQQLATLQVSPTPSIPMPLGPNGDRLSEIPLMAGGWDVGELQENPLFLKMQAVCEVA